MRKIYIVFIILSFSVHLMSQVPLRMSYQAVIRNSTNELIINHVIGMRISILHGSATGANVYSETQSPTTNSNGLVSIEIGGASGFESINWADGTYFIKTETDPAGGENYTITHTSQLLSVPYALFAGNAANGMTAGDISKLAGIEEGAEVNVNADWNATSGDALILNKPAGISGDGSETAVIAGTNVIVTGTGTLTNPYIINSTATSSHYIGELFQGGIIVSVWNISGIEHGLIASLTDVGSPAIWSNVSELVGISAQSPNDGQLNTNAIIAQSGHTSSAAKLCDDYVSDGYSDWYLPASWELHQCYNAAYIVNTILGAKNGFQFSYYWNSTESYDNYAGFQYFDYGSTYFDYKSSVYNVRAVRKF
jgi:hypothetical protein